jgi:transcriptional regulator with XRE-family HTH domain
MKKKSKIDKIPEKFRNIVAKQIKMIGLQIQNRRLEMGLTQEELAEKLDLSVMTIQFIEQARRAPSLVLLIYICLFLKIKIDVGDN